MVYRLVFAAQMVTQHGLSEVAMVILSSISQDRERYRRGVLRALRLMSYVCACAFGLLSAAGPWLVPLVFGPAWVPATEPLRVLAALSVGGAVVSIAGVTLVASGYATAFSRLAVGAAFAQLIAAAVAARWGLMAVAWSVGIAQCLAIIPALRMLSRHYDVSLRLLVSELAPILLLLAAGLFVADWTSKLSTAWYMQPAASAAFCLVMGLAAWPLARKEQAARRANAKDQHAREAQAAADSAAETTFSA
jgi:PST family polysaccharide transporter